MSSKIANLSKPIASSCTRKLLLIALTALLFGCGQANPTTSAPDPPPAPPPPTAPPPPPPNVIVRENQKPGDSSWQIAHPNPQGNTIIEGFASAPSVERGGTINLFVNTVAQTYTIDIYRVGWYGGLGARRMMPTITVNGTSQPLPTADPKLGLVEAVWTNPYTLSIPDDASDPTDWASGVYLAKLTASYSGGVAQGYIIFVVRDDARTTNILFQSSTNTYEAYNDWGGHSLYSNPRAYEVSYNRPYVDGNGAGQFFRWEYNMVRFLEREGYDVSYATDVDDHENAALLLNHKAFLIVGHDEYWTWQMFDNMQAARDAGVNLGFFSANDGHWQVRLQASTVDGSPDRTIVCYKSDVALILDPDAANPATAYLTTTEFRLPPVNRPEDTLIGEMSDDNLGANISADVVITDASDSVFEGTGLQNGNTLPKLVGNETDHVFGTAPANETVLAHSPVTDAVTGKSSFSDVTISTFPSGAAVFAVGTFQWSWGLDDSNFSSDHPVLTNTAAQQITQNILKQFKSAP